MIQELDTIVLARDIEEHGLMAGDAGAVVHCYSDGAAYEVEFVSAGGTTIALLTLSPADIRPVTGDEVLILHARALA
jgi:hypothetical protein